MLASSWGCRVPSGTRRAPRCSPGAHTHTHTYTHTGTAPARLEARWGPGARRAALDPAAPRRLSAAAPPPWGHACLRARSGAVGLRPSAAGGPRAGSSARCGRRVLTLPRAKDTRRGTALGSAAASSSERGRGTARPGSGPERRSAAGLAAGRGRRDLAAGRPRSHGAAPGGALRAGSLSAPGGTPRGRRPPPSPLRYLRARGRSLPLRPPRRSPGSGGGQLGAAPGGSAGGGRLRAGAD